MNDSNRSVHQGRRNRGLRETLFAVISVASFLIYAWGVLSLHQDRAAGWGIEAQGPIPVAISRLVYGTRLGAMDYDLFLKFAYLDGTTIQDLVAAAAKGAVPRGRVIMYSLDGNGVGANLLATLAMWMFGISISSLILFYLAFVGVTVAAFVARYRDRRLLVVPLYFLAVTVMLLTPLSTSREGVTEVAIGGIRYFTLAAFLPALHIVFELLERSDPPGGRRRIVGLLFLFVQAVLLFAALLVRASTGYLVVAIVLALAWRLYRCRRERAPLMPLASKGGVVGAALVLWALFIGAAFPHYVQGGRVLNGFWHRAFISFSFHPEWPFGNLGEVYDCRWAIPEGLTGARDLAGQCVWFAYPPNKGMSEGQLAPGIFGKEYQRALRKAYFYVLAHYPRQAFELYFFIKSRQIVDTLADGWSFLTQIAEAPVARELFIVVAVQLVLFLSFILAAALTGCAVVGRYMLVFPLLFLLSLAPRYVAWASWLTGADILLLMYSSLMVAVLLIGRWLR